MLCWNLSDLFAWCLSYNLQRRPCAVDGTLKSKNCCGHVLSTFLLCPLCWLHIWGMYRNLRSEFQWRLIQHCTESLRVRESVSLTPQSFNCSPFVCLFLLVVVFLPLFVVAFVVVGFFGSLAFSSIFSQRGSPVHTHAGLTFCPSLTNTLLSA